MRTHTQATNAKTTTLRTARIAAVQQALYAKRVAAKQVKFANATALHNKKAYVLAVQQLAAQYGVTHNAPVNRVQRVPTGTGICAQVHALCVANQGVRKLVLAAAHAAGINPATAATQYAVWCKANKVAA
jgi:hypothetical protein